MLRSGRLGLMTGLLCLCLTGRPGFAQLLDNHGAVGSANLAFSYNSLGLRLAGDYGYQWQLYEHDHRAFESNYVRAQGLLDLSPATLTAGASFRLQPASFANLGLIYRHRTYLAAFSNGATYNESTEAALLARFKDVDSFSEGDDLIYSIIEENEAQFGTRGVYDAHLLTSYGTLQFKLGSVFALFLAEFTQFWAALPDGQTHYYEPVLDLFIRDNDLFCELTGILGYEVGPVGLVVVSSTLLALKSEQRDLLLGPGLTWKITDRVGFLRNPSLLVVARWHLDHLWRTASQGVPAFGTILKTDF